MCGVRARMCDPSDYPFDSREYRPSRAPHAHGDYRLRECNYPLIGVQPCPDLNVMFNDQPFHMAGVAVNYALNAYAAYMSLSKHVW